MTQSVVITNDLDNDCLDLEHLSAKVAKAQVACNRRTMVDSTRLAFIDDKTLLSERTAVREALQREPARKPELSRVYDALTAEVDQRAAQVWSKTYKSRRESDFASRAPIDMSTWELIATYRHAWALSYYGPRGYLAKALANWLLTSQRELESRGAWVAEIMPPHNM